jgi:hypothetical protein
MIPGTSAGQLTLQGRYIETMRKTTYLEAILHIRPVRSPDGARQLAPWAQLDCLGILGGSGDLSTIESRSLGKDRVFVHL